MTGTEEDVAAPDPQDIERAQSIPRARGWRGLPYLGDPADGVCFDPERPSFRMAAGETWHRDYCVIGLGLAAGVVTKKPLDAIGPDAWIYFVGQQPDGPVKVGYSKNPFDRMASLQTGNPRPLALIWVVEGDLGTERMIHEALAEHRLGGEWFRRVPAVFDFIAGMEAFRELEREFAAKGRGA